MENKIKKRWGKIFSQGPGEDQKPTENEGYNALADKLPIEAKTGPEIGEFFSQTDNQIRIEAKRLVKEARIDSPHRITVDYNWLESTVKILEKIASFPVQDDADPKISDDPEWEMDPEEAIAYLECYGPGCMFCCTRTNGGCSSEDRSRAIRTALKALEKAGGAK